MADGRHNKQNPNTDEATQKKIRALLGGDAAKFLESEVLGRSLNVVQKHEGVLSFYGQLNTLQAKYPGFEGVPFNEIEVLQANSTQLEGEFVHDHAFGQYIEAARDLINNATINNTSETRSNQNKNKALAWYKEAVYKGLFSAEAMDEASKAIDQKKISYFPKTDNLVSNVANIKALHREVEDIALKLWAAYHGDKPYKPNMPLASEHRQALAAIDHTEKGTIEHTYKTDCQRAVRQAREELAEKMESQALDTTEATQQGVMEQLADIENLITKQTLTPEGKKKAKETTGAAIDAVNALLEKINTLPAGKVVSSTGEKRVAASASPTGVDTGAENLKKLKTFNDALVSIQKTLNGGGDLTQEDQKVLSKIKVFLDENENIENTFPRDQKRLFSAVCIRHISITAELEKNKENQETTPPNHKAQPITAQQEAAPQETAPQETESTSNMASHNTIDAQTETPYDTRLALSNSLFVSTQNLLKTAMYSSESSFSVYDVKSKFEVNSYISSILQVENINQLRAAVAEFECQKKELSDHFASKDISSRIDALRGVLEELAITLETPEQRSVFELYQNALECLEQERERFDYIQNTDLLQGQESPDLQTVKETARNFRQGLLSRSYEEEEDQNSVVAQSKLNNVTPALLQAEQQLEKSYDDNRPVHNTLIDSVREIIQKSPVNEDTLQQFRTEFNKDKSTFIVCFLYDARERTNSLDRTVQEFQTLNPEGESERALHNYQVSLLSRVQTDKVSNFAAQLQVMKEYGKTLDSVETQGTEEEEFKRAVLLGIQGAEHDGLVIQMLQDFNVGQETSPKDIARFQREVQEAVSEERVLFAEEDNIFKEMDLSNSSPQKNSATHAAFTLLEDDKEVRKKIIENLEKREEPANRPLSAETSEKAPTPAAPMELEAHQIKHAQKPVTAANEKTLLSPASEVVVLQENTESSKNNKPEQVQEVNSLFVMRIKEAEEKGNTHLAAALRKMRDNPLELAQYAHATVNSVAFALVQSEREISQAAKEITLAETVLRDHAHHNQLDDEARTLAGPSGQQGYTGFVAEKANVLLTQQKRFLNALNEKDKNGFNYNILMKVISDFEEEISPENMPQPLVEEVRAIKKLSKEISRLGHELVNASTKDALEADADLVASGANEPLRALVYTQNVRLVLEQVHQKVGQNPNERRFIFEVLSSEKENSTENQQIHQTLADNPVLRRAVTIQRERGARLDQFKPSQQEERGSKEHQQSARLSEALGLITLLNKREELVNQGLAVVAQADSAGSDEEEKDLNQQHQFLLQHLPIEGQSHPLEGLRLEEIFSEFNNMIEMDQVEVAEQHIYDNLKMAYTHHQYAAVPLPPQQFASLNNPDTARQTASAILENREKSKADPRAHFSQEDVQNLAGKMGLNYGEILDIAQNIITQEVHLALKQQVEPKITLEELGGDHKAQPIAAQQEAAPQETESTLNMAENILIKKDHDNTAGNTAEMFEHALRVSLDGRGEASEERAYRVEPSLVEVRNAFKGNGKQQVTKKIAAAISQINLQEASYKQQKQNFEFIKALAPSIEQKLEQPDLPEGERKIYQNLSIAVKLVELEEMRVEKALALKEVLQRPFEREDNAALIRSNVDDALSDHGGFGSIQDRMAALNAEYIRNTHGEHARYKHNREQTSVALSEILADVSEGKYTQALESLNPAAERQPLQQVQEGAANNPQPQHEQDEEMKSQALDTTEATQQGVMGPLATASGYIAVIKNLITKQALTPEGKKRAQGMIEAGRDKVKALLEKTNTLLGGKEEDDFTTRKNQPKIIIEGLTGPSGHITTTVQLTVEDMKKWEEYFASVQPAIENPDDYEDVDLPALIEDTEGRLKELQPFMDAANTAEGGLTQEAQEALTSLEVQVLAVESSIDKAKQKLQKAESAEKPSFQAPEVEGPPFAEAVQPTHFYEDGVESTVVIDHSIPETEEAELAEIEEATGQDLLDKIRARRDEITARQDALSAAFDRLEGNRESDQQQHEALIQKIRQEEEKKGETIKDAHDAWLNAFYKKYEELKQDMLKTTIEQTAELQKEYSALDPNDPEGLEKAAELNQKRLSIQRLLLGPLLEQRLADEDNEHLKTLQQTLNDEDNEHLKTLQQTLNKEINFELTEEASAERQRRYEEAKAWAASSIRGSDAPPLEQAPPAEQEASVQEVEPETQQQQEVAKPPASVGPVEAPEAPAAKPATSTIPQGVAAEVSPSSELPEVETLATKRVSLNSENSISVVNVKQAKLVSEVVSEVGEAIYAQRNNGNSGYIGLFVNTMDTGKQEAINKETFGHLNALREENNHSVAANFAVQSLALGIGLNSTEEEITQAVKSLKAGDMLILNGRSTYGKTEKEITKGFEHMDRVLSVVERYAPGIQVAAYKVNRRDDAPYPYADAVAARGITLLEADPIDATPVGDAANPGVKKQYGHGQVKTIEHDGDPRYYSQAAAVARLERWQEQHGEAGLKNLIPTEQRKEREQVQHAAQLEDSFEL